MNHETATTPIDARVASLIAARRPGHALDRAFYTDPGIFALDLERFLFRRWICAGHESRIPSAGEFFTMEIGRESVIVVRTADGRINALLNVCRHRGSRLCEGRSGRVAAGRLTCPYHAWTYDLDGKLLAARQMGDDFDPSASGLRRLAVEVAEGLVFVSFAAAPPDFSRAREVLAATAGVHGWGRAKVAHSETYTINANWKLAVENYMECYHCQPAHAEFARRHVYSRPAEQAVEVEAAARARSEALGIRIGDVDEYASMALPGGESVSILRSALSDGHLTASPDGRAVSTLMGAFGGLDGSSTYFDIGPVSDFLAYADHGVMYRFIPKSAELTEMEVVWLVDRDAVEGRDYEVERLTWLWRATSVEDKKIIEMNAQGVSSAFFVPGPYGRQEPYAGRFVDWYLGEIAPRTTPGSGREGARMKLAGR